MSGRAPGTITWLPKPGARIELGRQLYRSDDLPVTLFYGKLPLYRPIAGKNLIGRDVKVIAENLSALGYPIGEQPSSVGRRKEAVTVRSGEAVLTKDLVKAVRQWQEDTHRPVTGRIEVGDVEIQPGPVRVQAVLAQTGDPAEQPLLELSSTRKGITVMATMSEAGGIEQGDAVKVRMPDDTTVAGTVSSVGRTLQADDTGDTQKLAVSIRVDKRKALAKLDAAEVDVDFVARTEKDALVAPVEALVSLSEGGYAVEMVDDGGLVAVETGMFADGFVQIEGEGLDAGVSVVVAS